MLLNNPKKFTTNGGVNPLIGLQDIIIQYSTAIQPSVNDNSWTNSNSINPDQKYQWVRFSFDSGAAWSYIKLNTVNNISFEFNISDVTNDSNNVDYPYYYRFTITDENMYNTVKNKPLSLFIGNTNETISFSAPIRYKTGTNGYYIDILFTDTFINQFSNCTCYINS